MRVAIDVVPIRPGGQVGGANHLVFEIIKGLATQYKSDKYIILTAEWNHEYFQGLEKYGIERVCIANSGLASKTGLLNYFIECFKRLFNIIKPARILKELNIDVLFCAMSATTYAEPGIPTISLIYDIQHEYYPQFFSQQELMHRKKFYQGICKTADAVICISQFSRDTFVNKYNFLPEKAHVIYIGIQDRISVPNSDEMQLVLKKYNLEQKEYGYFPANFWPHKNHHMLLTAYSVFIRKNPQYNLHLVFTGALLETNKTIKDAVQQMGLSENVHFLGYLSEDELAAILAGCQFVIFPSLFEGFGIPVAEAMSFGKPVLCSNVTSLPEVGGEAALYFDPRRPEQIVSAMEKIYAEASIREEVVAKGYKQIEKFNINDMIHAYRKVLHEFAIKGGGNGYKVQGIYEDGWTGPAVTVISGKSTADCFLEIEISCIGPVSNVKIITKLNDVQTAKYIIKSGQTCLISQAFPAEPSEIELHISPTFNPSDAGSEDNRVLGLHVKKAEIRNAKTGALVDCIY